MSQTEENATRCLLSRPVSHLTFNVRSATQSYNLRHPTFADLLDIRSFQCTSDPVARFQDRPSLPAVDGSVVRNALVYEKDAGLDLFFQLEAYLVSPFCLRTVRPVERESCPRAILPAWSKTVRQVCVPACSSLARRANCYRAPRFEAQQVIIPGVAMCMVWTIVYSILCCSGLSTWV